MFSSADWVSVYACINSFWSCTGLVRYCAPLNRLVTPTQWELSLTNLSQAAVGTLGSSCYLRKAHKSIERPKIMLWVAASVSFLG